MPENENDFRENPKAQDKKRKIPVNFEIEKIVHVTIKN